MPPCACSMSPLWRALAPVNAPASWPNSSDSSKSWGSAAQFTSTSGAAARWSGIMQDLRSEPLARAGFAGDGDRGKRHAGQTSQHVAYRLRRRPLADIGVRLKAAAFLVHLAGKAALGDGAARRAGDDEIEAVGVARLGQKVERTEA